MRHGTRRSGWTAVLAAGAAVLAASSARADDRPWVDPGDAVLVSGTPPEPPPPPRAAPSALREAADSITGPWVNGRITFKGQLRLVDDGDDDENDTDLYTTLDLRLGDASHDEWSGAAYVRTDWDFDPRPRGGAGSSLLSLSDASHREMTALVHTAYATWRPGCGPVESARFGRQYVDVAETFHVDGASVESMVHRGAMNARFRAWGGVPVHFYESSSSGDFAAGFEATAEPWRRGRVTLDYAHVQDEYSGYGEERNDLAVVQVKHAIDDRTDVSGRFSWLEGPRDARLRAAYRIPSQDLLLQASYFRLLEDQDLRSTEFDPYFSVLRTFRPYHTADVRAVKGFGERLSVEAGASARRVIDGSDVGPFNRETERFWLAPTFEDVVWEGLSVTLGGEQWRGDDERIRTWTADVTKRFGRDMRASVGTDFALWDWDRLRPGERERVRSVWGRLRKKLTDGVDLDFRYTWERDEEETSHVVTLALAFDF